MSLPIQPTNGNDGAKERVAKLIIVTAERPATVKFERKVKLLGTYIETTRSRKHTDRLCNHTYNILLTTYFRFCSVKIRAVNFFFCYGCFYFIEESQLYLMSDKKTNCLYLPSHKTIYLAFSFPNISGDMFRSCCH